MGKKILYGTQVETINKFYFIQPSILIFWNNPTYISDDGTVVLFIQIKYLKRKQISKGE